MNATDELRALLDERGVEHYDGVERTLWLKDEHGYRASADELTSGRMSVHMWCKTPEQAVEATLGRGECHDTGVYVSAFECSACGEVYEMHRDPDYCPGCGARVIGG